MNRVRAINRFFETARGVGVSWAIWVVLLLLLGHAGLPDGAYAFRTKGLYDCPDGQYESDPSFAPFTLGQTPATR